MAFAPDSVKYINPFVLSTLHVFRTALGVSLKRGEPFRSDLAPMKREITGIIGLSGKANGTVILEMPRSTAIQITGRMLGDAPAEVNADVVDAVGEVTNMVAGAAKAKMEELQMSIGLPSVIVGCEHIISFPTDVPRIALPFHSEIGTVHVEVSFTESASFVKPSRARGENAVKA